MHPEAVAALVARNKARATHVYSGKPEYAIYMAMVQRCTRPLFEFYYLYGGRGIRVCDEWLADFAAFLRDVGPRPTDEMTLDRIDPDGNYEPGNVRWVTATEQARNKRNNHRMTLNGETATIAEWSERTGISSRTIENRLRTLGWSDERALTEPARRLTLSLTVDGRTMKIADWVSETGVRQQTISGRLARGWSAKEAVYGR